MNQALSISASTLVSALGVGKQAHLESLQNERSGLKLNVNSLTAKLDAFFGEVQGLNELSFPSEWSSFDCRNHRLALLALETDGFRAQVESAKQRYGATRIGLAVGTSTSGILATEEVLAYRESQGKFYGSYDYAATHRMNALSDFCASALGIEGPRLTISTACSSSAKVFASAARWIKYGLADAVIVGGVDTLCLTTIHGFNSLGLISQGITRPLDECRDGINVGEAGGFMLLESAPTKSNQVKLLGVGESSDAYHISSPHPEGAGAVKAMRQALKSANCKASNVDYINMHGTGTSNNDEVEAKAMHTVFEDSLPLHSSTKGFTGHTLGAAGITEAVICELALKHQFAPKSINLQTLDKTLGLQPVIKSQSEELRICMSNSFGFGGNNACLLFGLGAQR